MNSLRYVISRRITINPPYWSAVMPTGKVAEEVESSVKRVIEHHIEMIVETAYWNLAAIRREAMTNSRRSFI